MKKMTIAYKCDKCGGLLEDASYQDTLTFSRYQVVVRYAILLSTEKNHFCRKCRIDLLKGAIEKLQKDDKEQTHEATGETRQKKNLL